MGSRKREKTMKKIGLITVAGMSRRMGNFKPLMPLGDKTVIETTVQALLHGGAEEVVAVLGRNGDAIREALKGLPVDFVCNEHYETTDMYASVCIGMSYILRNKEADIIYLLPGDMPAVDGSILGKLADEMQRGDYDIVFPSCHNRRHHPPAIARRCLSDFLKYSGEDGLRGAFRLFEGRIGYVLTEDEGCTFDIDTPEDYERLLKYWRKRQEGTPV